MYLLFNNITTDKKQLKGFKRAINYICFTFDNIITEKTFTEIEKIKMYSDDNIFLSEFILEDYSLVYNNNELFLKNKNEVVDIKAVKEDYITKSKTALAEWLENNSYLHTDGKYYACTAEKQSLLNSNLASYERAKSVGIDYPLKWNSTGDECTEWEYTALLTLSLSIAAYVAPKVSKQQSIEIQINACETTEDVYNVVINYDE